MAKIERQAVVKRNLVGRILVSQNRVKRLAVVTLGNSHLRSMFGMGTHAGSRPGWCALAYHAPSDATAAKAATASWPWETAGHWVHETPHITN